MTSTRYRVTLNDPSTLEAAVILAQAREAALGRLRPTASGRSRPAVILSDSSLRPVLFVYLPVDDILRETLDSVGYRLVIVYGVLCQASLVQ